MIHGSADTDVPPANSDRAAAEIPDAERVVMEGGTHLCLWVHPDAAEIQQTVITHLSGGG